MGEPFGLPRILKLGQMMTALGFSEWAGLKIQKHLEPWYRYDRVAAIVEQYVSPRSGAKWLDVGCQMGQFLAMVRHRFAAETTGIDDFKAETVVEVCRKYLHMEIGDPRVIFDGSWSYFDRRIDQVGFSLGTTYDIISALEVLEHMVDTDAFFRECSLHLAPGGHLVISTPNINSLRNRVTVPLGAYPAGMEYRTVIHHVRLYNVSTLVAHAKASGFTLVTVHGVSFLPAKLLSSRVIRKLDQALSKLFPSFCGNIIGVFKKDRESICREGAQPGA